MKKCPYCAEEIQDEAIVCRFCGRDLKPVPSPIQSNPPRNPVNPPAQPKPTQKRGGFLKWLLGLSVLVIFCLCVSFFGLVNLGRNVSSTQTITNTVEEINRRSETPSLTLTSTSTLTSTNTLTSTFTVTPSLTPEPATQTAIALNKTATQKAGNATATKLEANIRATGTAQAISDLATLIAQYTRISPKELVTYPNNHIGELVVVRGKVFNVNSDTEFQIWIDGLSFKAVYIVMLKPFSDIYEDDYITIYGVVIGEQCGTNAFGQEVCQPVIYGDFYEKK